MGNNFKVSYFYSSEIDKVRKENVIDRMGFRRGIGIVLLNTQRQIFLARRLKVQSWQLPQGGMLPRETFEETMYRELNEEVGLNPDDIGILAVSRRLLWYRLPRCFIRYRSKPLCIGQKQRWFLLKLVHQQAKIDLQASPFPEFDAWKWAPYWYPLREVIAFKRRVYLLALKEFSPIVFSNRFLER